MEKFNIIKDSAELRKIITENPDLPICVLVGQEAASDDFGYTYCENVSCCVDYILDCRVPFKNDNIVYNDKDEFEDDLANWMGGLPEYEPMTDAEFEAALKTELDKYAPYWKKAIVITADNM